jgi:hypothetical protein
VRLTKCRTLSIVSFHRKNLTFPTHDFYIDLSAVSLAQR